MKENTEAIQPGLDTHQTPENWAKEGAAMAPKVLYLASELLKRRGGSKVDVPYRPSENPPACGRVAQVRIGKERKRFADEIRGPNIP